MILLHQIWNQRRQNLWIFIELLIAGFFLWMVIDPIYVLTANRLIPQGGDTRGMYVLNLGQYDKSFGEYDPTQDSAQVMRRHYQDIVRAVRTCPEVEAFTVSAYSSFPNSMSWSGMELFNEDSGSNTASSPSTEATCRRPTAWWMSARDSPSPCLPTSPSAG